jgi:hypothetical protein
MRQTPNGWLIAGATVVLALILTPLILTASPALAQSGGGFDLSWSTVDGGGGTSAGGGFRVTGTAGQPDPGEMAGGSIRVGGGFWGGGFAAEDYDIYLPLVLR